MSTERRPRICDHRLIRLVQETSDATIATNLGIPRSTVAGWLKRAPQLIISAPGLDASAAELRVRVAKLERRVARLTAILRIFFALFRLLQPDLTRLRVPQGATRRGCSGPSTAPAASWAFAACSGSSASRPRA